MNVYDHEDAFKSANRHAGSVVKLGDAIKHVTDRDSAVRIIDDCRNHYEDLFDAFISGVAWARQEEKNKLDSKKYQEALAATKKPAVSDAKEMG